MLGSTEAGSRAADLTRSWRPNTKVPAAVSGLTTSSAETWLQSAGVPAGVGRSSEPIASFSPTGGP